MALAGPVIPPVQDEAGRVIDHGVVSSNWPSPSIASLSIKSIDVHRAQQAMKRLAINRLLAHGQWSMSTGEYYDLVSHFHRLWSCIGSAEMEAFKRKERIPAQVELCVAW